ncbi:hypothetical protein VNO77_17829 [Canavalia gladiata]|uniref:Uncharacterized protein n=1 Tax=Canavalia gladiata TaxID=3824 RepID=A0AAN9QJ20_CANGL
MYNINVQLTLNYRYTFLWAHILLYTHKSPPPNCDTIPFYCHLLSVLLTSCDRNIKTFAVVSWYGALNSLPLFSACLKLQPMEELVEVVVYGDLRYGLNGLSIAGWRCDVYG